MSEFWCVHIIFSSVSVISVATFWEIAANLVHHLFSVLTIQYCDYLHYKLFPVLVLTAGLIAYNMTRKQIVCLWLVVFLFNVPFNNF